MHEEVDYRDPPGPGTASRDLPVIDAATAKRSWVRLLRYREHDPGRYERVLPRFLNLCAALPEEERGRLTGELGELVRRHRAS